MNPIAKKMSRRRFLGLALAGVGAAATTGLYTWQVEPHWLEITSRILPITNLPVSLVGRRVAQISDIHIGRGVDDMYLQRCFAAVDRIAPELVLYTGDFTSYDDRIFSHLRKVAPRLPRGSLGTFGILGNHDYGPDWAYPEVAAEIGDIVSDAGVRILRNETVDVNGLQIVGMDDLWAEQFVPGTALAGYQEDRAALALSHNPDTVDMDGWGNFAGWILAGHTHGGQCKAPFLPPPLLPVQNRRYTSGMFDLQDGRAMYISRGVGHVLRVRFDVRPEITIFTLARA